MKLGTALATAVAGLMFSGFAMAQDAQPAAAAKPELVKCEGANSCGGKGACGGATNECAGKNECKGKGFLKVTKEECEAKGGKVKA